MNTIFRILVVGLLVLVCVKLHEIAQHTRLAGVALSLIALRSDAPPPTSGHERPSLPSDSRVVRN